MFSSLRYIYIYIAISNNCLLFFYYLYNGVQEHPRSPKKEEEDKKQSLIDGSFLNAQTIDQIDINTDNIQEIAIMNLDKLAHSAPSSFQFSPDDNYVTYLASQQLVKQVWGLNVNTLEANKIVK